MSVLACGKTTLVGTWEMDLEAEFAKLSEEEKAQIEALGYNVKDFTYELTFNADGTGSMVQKAMGQEYTTNFTYTEENGKLKMTATIEGMEFTQEATYTINGNMITLTEGETSQSFKRK